jgi:hypothetical protein
MVSNAFDYDLILLRYNDSGGLLGNSTSTGVDDEGYGVSAVIDGIYVTGSTYSGVNYDIVTLKYESSSCSGITAQCDCEIQPDCLWNKSALLTNLTDYLPYKQSDDEASQGYTSIGFDNKNNLLYLASDNDSTPIFVRLNLSNNLSENLTSKYVIGRIHKIMVDNTTDLVYLYDDALGGIIVYNYTNNETASILTSSPFRNMMLAQDPLLIEGPGVYFTGSMDLLNSSLYFRALNDSADGIFKYDYITNTTTFISNGSDLTGFVYGLRSNGRDTLYLSGNYTEGIGLFNLTNNNLTVLTLDKEAPTMTDMHLEEVTGVTSRTYYAYTNCTDTNGIAKNYPKVSFTNPFGELKGNYTMSRYNDNQFRYPISFNIPGVYTDFTFYCRDTYNNLFMNDSTGLAFVSTERNIGASSGGGGGGGGTRTTTVLQNVTLPSFCGDGICDVGENQLSCPQDCSVNIEGAISCIWTDPKTCFSSNTWFITAAFIIVVGSVVWYFFISGNNKGGRRRW